MSLAVFTPCPQPANQVFSSLSDKLKDPFMSIQTKTSSATSKSVRSALTLTTATFVITGAMVMAAPEAMAQSTCDLNGGGDGVANATGFVALACGELSDANGAESTAIGGLSEAEGDFATAIGGFARAQNDEATAVGAGSSATGLESIALGAQSSATAESSIGIGRSSQATAIGLSRLAVAPEPLRHKHRPSVPMPQRPAKILSL